MHRLIVALLAAFDAVIAAAGGIALALAPLTLLWVVGLGTGADWGALWPASAAIWQFGHLVPLTVVLPDTYLAAAGIDPTAAGFVLSLAPLGFALFTALFAARSGRRAAEAGAELTGPVTGTLVFALLALVVALTAGGSLESARVDPAPVVFVQLWQAVLFPALVFAVPAVAGAFAAAWQIADRGVVERLRARVDRWPGGWAHVPGLVARGAAIAVLGLIGVGALVVAVAVFASAGQIVALFQAGNVDAVGATVIALAQLAYLPTLVVWGVSFAAGPGFALGVGTAVSPSGTQLGVIPGIPALGAVPESTSPWLLLLALLPVAVGALTGWMLRSRLAAASSLAGRAEAQDGGAALRLTVAGAVAVLAGAGAAALAALAAGSMGPGRLAETGPQAGPVFLAVTVEILVGAGILLGVPRRAGTFHPAPDPDSDAGFDSRPWPVIADSHAGGPDATDPDATAPIPGLGRGERPGGSVD